MIAWRAKRLAACALLAIVLSAFQGCNSDTQARGINAGGRSSSGAGSYNGSGADSAVAGAGGESGMGGASSATGDPTCPDPTHYSCNPDLSCDTSNAKSDAECSIDCKIPCGFDQMGTKHCSCVGGVYSQCPCPRPPSYAGALTAKWCSDPSLPFATESGLMVDMKGEPCAAEWEQCIATDIPPGSTPRGCVCMLNQNTEVLQWYCGSTNKWFSLEQ